MIDPAMVWENIGVDCWIAERIAITGSITMNARYPAIYYKWAAIIAAADLKSKKDY
jgi:hypothetical protein